MPDELKKSQLRAIQFFYVDGTFEFSFGFLCLLLAIYFYLAAHVQGWLSAIVEASLVLVTIGGAVGAVTTVLAMTQDLQIAVMPLLSGFLFGMVMVILGWRASIPRFYLLAFLSAALGVALAYSGLGDTVSLIAYYASIAVVLIFSGTCVLRTFLRKNPMPKDSPDEQ